jgi:Gluconate 2-dehydrogenase subunit 3
VSDSKEFVQIGQGGESNSTVDMSRRRAMQWVMAAVAASQMPSISRGQPLRSPSQQPQESGAVNRPVDRTGARQEGVANRVGNVPGGYGTDPDLVKSHKPGEFWSLTFNDAQKKTATTLADIIMPQDQWGPAASTLGVVPMIDEWISSPYPQTQGDKPVILEGLVWIETESQKRFGKGFSDVDEKQQAAICDDICYYPKAPDHLKKQAVFFSRFRSLTAGAYYATPQGWHAIGYVGNAPLNSFDGPPPEVLEKLGVEQTVE